jgi:hypothetical protein
VEIVKKSAVFAALVLDAGALAFLGGGFVAPAIFILFIALFLIPAFIIAARAPFVRDMPADLRITSAAVIVVLLAVPWYFFRKLFGMTLPVDAAASILLTVIAFRLAPRALFDELRPSLRRLAPVLILLPLMTALVFLGFEVRVGTEVRYYGLLAIDLGNLATAVSSIRISPMLPLSLVDGGGNISYHWLYFTMPALLSDFLGASIPSANALILTNLLMAALLFQTVVMTAGWFDDWRGRHYHWIAAVVLFAPFTTYFYQAAATRFPIGWFALPTRNHLLLSPLNSMITFGNNTFALVLCLFVLVEVERWNRDGKLADAVLGVIALAVIIGYSVTLVFSVAVTLVVWTILGRVRRPVVALGLAVVAGVCAVAIFFAIGILAGGGSRGIAIGFDRGQFFRMVLFGLAPLWVAVVLGGRARLNIFHVLIAVAIAVPSLLYTTGSSGSQIDFSMKTGSLLAIAFTPLLAPAFRRLFGEGVPRWRAWVAMFVIALGAVQSSAFLLQFPWYRFARPSSRGYSTPAGYHDALIWIRDHTPERAVVVDPQPLKTHEVVDTMMIGERRIWLPTAYTNDVMIIRPHVGDRLALWRSFAAGDADAGRRIAAEADYLVLPGSVASTSWREVRRGQWSVYQSTMRKP